MSLAKQHASARALLEDCRAQQRQLLQRAWDDSFRTLTNAETEQYDQLEADAAALDLEVRRLGELVELDASTARPPRSDPDWR